MSSSDKESFDVEDPNGKNKKRCGCGWPCCYCCSCTIGIIWFLSLVALALLMFFLVPRPPCVGVKKFVPEQVRVEPPNIFLQFKLWLSITNYNWIGVTINKAALDVYYVGVYNQTTGPFTPPITRQLNTLIGQGFVNSPQTISPNNADKDETFLVSVAGVTNPDTPMTAQAMAADYYQNKYWMLRIKGWLDVAAIGSSFTVWLDIVVPVPPKS